MQVQGHAFAALALTVLAGCQDEPAGPGTGSPSLIDPTKRPRVLATLPPAGGTGPYRLYGPATPGNPHFTVEFTKLIERSSFGAGWIGIDGFPNAVRAVVLDPPGTDPVYDPPPHLQSVLAFEIRDQATSKLVAYEVGHTYTITIRSELTDFTGQRLLTPYQFSFVAEPRFRVVSMSPPAGDRVVLPNATIAVQFNSPVADGISTALRLSPDAPGAWRLAESNPYRVEFRHPEPLQFGAAYTLEVLDSAADAQGHVVAAPSSAAFSTRAFEVMGFNPGANDTAVAVTAGVNLLFSGEIDSATVRPHFRIEPAVPGTLSLGYIASFWRPQFELDTSTTYRVTVSDGVLAANGTPLASALEFSFTTVPFRIDSSSPATDSWDNYWRSPVEIGCSARIDSNTVRAAFTISPPTTGRLRFYDRSFAYWPVALVPATEYTVTVSTALRSQRGAALATPYRFSFHTEGGR